MKMRKIGRILTVMFLTGGLMTGCQKKQTVVLPEKEQKEEATETESKNKETQEISFDEELPKDYEGTLTMWGWDTDYYQTVTQAFQEIYPNVTFEYTSVEHKDLPQKYETALIVGGELPDIAWSVIVSEGKCLSWTCGNRLSRNRTIFAFRKFVNICIRIWSTAKEMSVGLSSHSRRLGWRIAGILQKNISVRTTRKSWRR